MSAEAVHRALEDTVPAMEYYYARNIFTKAEIKDIVKARTAAEYKLHGPGATYTEVIKAVDYERGIEKLRKVRGKNVPLKNRFDEHIVQRIEKLYDRFVDHMEGEDRINLAKHELEWLSTSKAKDHEKKAGQVLGRLVNENPTRDDLWVHAAKYEMERKNIDNARALLQQGLRVLPQSTVLWRAYFMIELTYLGELLDALKADEKAQDEDLDPKLRLVLNGAIPLVVHRHAVKAMQAKKKPSATAADPALLLTVDFLKIGRKFGFTAKIVDALTAFLRDADGVRCVEQDVAGRCGGLYKLLDDAKTPSQYLGRLLDGSESLDDPNADGEDDEDARAEALLAKACAAAEGVFEELFALLDHAATNNNNTAPLTAAQTIGAVLLLAEQCVRSAYALPASQHLMSAPAISADAYDAAAPAPVVDETKPLFAPLLGGATARNEHPLFKAAMGGVQRLLAHAAVPTHATPAQVVELHHLGAKLAGGAETSPVAAVLLDLDALAAAPTPAARAVSTWCLAVELARAAGSPAVAEVVSCGLAATKGTPDQHRLWVLAVLAAYQRAAANPKAAKTLKKTLTDALGSASALPAGARRAEALEKIGAVALMADPATSLAALRAVHLLPEALAAQMICAAISLYDVSPTAADGPAIKRRKVAAAVDTVKGKGVNEIRSLFDHLVYGPSGLRRSARLWALWIRWEQGHSTQKSLHVRTTATRNPGGIPVGDLDTELAAIPCL